MGFITQLVGGGIQGAQQLAQGKKDAATAAENQQLADFQASDALLRGSIEESRYRRYVASVLGQQKAEIGARNVAVSGTALDLLGDTAFVGEEEAQTIRNNASREAWSYRQQANEASRWGANQKSNSRYAAGNTLLTSGAAAYGTWSERNG